MSSTEKLSLVQNSDFRYSINFSLKSAIKLSQCSFFGRQFRVQLNFIFTDETAKNGKADTCPLSASLTVKPSFF
jgi:hypothetical protein